jgi:protein TonB
VIAASRPNLLPDAPAPVLPSRPVPKSSATALPGQLIYRVPPVYPQMARNLGFQATLVLKVQIAKDGSVRDVRLVRGERMFLESATTAVKQWRYRPAFLNGQPVESTADVVLRFTGPK